MCIHVSTCVDTCKHGYNPLVDPGGTANTAPPTGSISGGTNYPDFHVMWPISFSIIFVPRWPMSKVNCQIAGEIMDFY